VTDPKRYRRVLVVDDNEDARELYEQLLTLDGHSLTTAATGERGLALLLSASFDVAVIDIGLPDVDGYALASAARAKLGDRAPVLIALTGFVTAAHREKAARAGFDAHLPKPIDPAVLSLAVTTEYRR